jgi:tetratricopeptide (TPR) repeat protein
LVLASYPPQLARRYGTIGEVFCEAVLLAHEGHEREALECFSRLPEAEHDDLFLFERGSLLSRLGEFAAGRADLEKALALNPDFALAAETLVQLELAAGDEAAAEERVQQMQRRGMSAAFCHGVMASLRAGQGRLEEALTHGFRALEAGGSSDHALLTASLLERVGRFDEAEALLSRLPSAGGCSGGAGLALAEFWLRHGKNLDKALEAFKAALRHEPDSPRWVLRVAQAYFGLGWRKEGLALLEKALADSRLEPALYEEGVATRAGGQ